MPLYNTPPKVYSVTETRTSSCQYVVSFCVKYRRKVLTSPVNTFLRDFIMNNQKVIGYKIISLDIFIDNVQMVIEVEPKIGIHKVITNIKGNSTPLLMRKFPELKSRVSTVWCKAYWVSTLGKVNTFDLFSWLETQHKS